MIAPREMRRRHDHESAHVAVGRGVAETRAAAGAEEARGAHLRVTHAERGRCRVGQALGETHHHQVRAHLARAGARSGGILLGGWGDELEEEIFEVSLVHGNAERAWSYEIAAKARLSLGFIILGTLSGFGGE